MRKTIAGVLTSVMLLSTGLAALAGPTDLNKDIYSGVSNSISNLDMVNEHKTIIVSKIHSINKTDIEGMFMDDITGDGEVTIALQIYSIPTEHTGFGLYFSTDAVVAQ